LTPNIINLSGGIILAELVEAIVKELSLIVFRVQMNMLPAISVSSIISKPNIVSLPGQLDREGLVGMECPEVSIAEEAVLDEDDRSTGLVLSWILDSEECKLIAIRGRQCM